MSEAASCPDLDYTHSCRDENLSDVENFKVFEIFVVSKKMSKVNLKMS